MNGLRNKKQQNVPKFVILEYMTCMIISYLVDLENICVVFRLNISEFIFCVKDIKPPTDQTIINM